MRAAVPDQADRRDVVWQLPSTTASYHRSRPGIPFANAQFDIAVRVLRAHDVRVRTVLDLGCGDGIATQEMADRFSLERAVLVDFSEPMLEEARARFMEAAFDIHLRFVDMLHDAALDELVELGPFDLVLSRYAIHHLPQARQRSLYEEAFHLLTPGGMFINIEHVKSPNDRYQAAFDRLIVEGIHSLDSLDADHSTIEETEQAYRQLEDREANILAPVEDQCAWLREIGFVDVDCSFKVLELAVFGGRKPRGTGDRSLI